MDASDNGVDLAISKAFTHHKPSSLRWEQLQHPNARWLTYRPEATEDQLSRTVYLNLLDGVLRVGGQPFCRFPPEIRHSSEGRRIFCDVRASCTF